MIYKFKILNLLLVMVLAPSFVFGANNINVNVSDLSFTSNVSFSPRSGTFTEGSTFDVPILLDTKGSSINGIELKINFDKDKLSIVEPSNGKSIVGVWVEPPKYDNSRGTASFVGVIPDGIKTDSGLIGTITFKAKSSGRAVVRIASDSSILLNDGLGTEVSLGLGRAEYDIIPKAPEGVVVFSQTHPNQSDWYNNNNPIVSWEGLGNEGFSIVLDDKPFTIPDNTVDLTENSKSFESLSDGLWHFHIKSKKSGVWGGTSHFLLKIDTTPPARFTPETNYVVASVILVERTLVSFFTTDNMSGVDYYEVGVIDKSQPVSESPVFVQASSPFQVPITKNGNLRVIVRAVDKAGNVRDESVNVNPPFVITKFIEDYLVYILLFIIIIGIVSILIHYFISHHIVRYFKEKFSGAKKDVQYKQDNKWISPEQKINNNYSKETDKFDGGTI